MKGKFDPEKYPSIKHQYRALEPAPKRGIRKKHFYQTVISIVVFLVVIASFRTDYQLSRLVREQAGYHLSHKLDLSPVMASLKKLVVLAAGVVTGNEATTTGASTDILPVSGRVIQEFGAYTSKDDGAELFHNGVDIQAEGGSSVRAVLSGKVVQIQKSDQGSVLEIKQSDEVTALYGYCRTVLVAKGAQVQEGQNLATLGEAGGSQAVLHFEIRVNGQPVDPVSYLDTNGL